MSNGTSDADRLGRADLQIHTSHGDGMGNAAEIFDVVDKNEFLDVIAITDHDDINGALLAREIHAQKRRSFDLITGIEITTLQVKV